jgi:hypothetical protein
MRKISTKGQGMPLNVIIIAVICLLVLIVLIFIFTGKTGQFSKGVDTCASRGGVCQTSAETCNGPTLKVGTSSNAGEVSCDLDNDGVQDGVRCCLMA